MNFPPAALMATATWPEKIDDTIWLKVTNDRHGCLKSACPNRPECPFYLARDVLETVDVVVANHDLLLADISMGGGVILPAPENSFYCIDEAHHLSKKPSAALPPNIHGILPFGRWKNCRSLPAKLPR